MNTIDRNAVVFTVFSVKRFRVHIIGINSEFRFEHLRPIGQCDAVLPAIILIGITVDAKAVCPRRAVVRCTTVFVDGLRNSDGAIPIDNLTVISGGRPSQMSDQTKRGSADPKYRCFLHDDSPSPTQAQCHNPRRSHCPLRKFPCLIRTQFLSLSIPLGLPASAQRVQLHSSAPQSFPSAP